MKKIPFILMVVLAVLALGSLPCLAQGDFPGSEKQASSVTSNLASPPDTSWVLLYVPIGQYRFDASVFLDQMSQNKVSPAVNNNPLEQDTFTVQFSLRW